MAAPGSSGIHLAVAVFCERTLYEQDGVVSVIRIVNRFSLEATAPDASETMPLTPLNLTAFFSFHSEHTRSSTLRLSALSPSGKRFQSEMPMSLEADKVHNVTVDLVMNSDEQGVYWFDVSVDGEHMTRMPMYVRYVRRAAPTGSGGN